MLVTRIPYFSLIVLGSVNPLPDKKFRIFQTERICRRQFQIWWKWLKVIQTGRKHCGKRRNCLLQAISPFPTVFSKGLLPRRVKRCHCVGMGKPITTQSQVLTTLIMQTLESSMGKGENAGKMYFFPISSMVFCPSKVYAQEVACNSFEFLQPMGLKP